MIIATRTCGGVTQISTGARQFDYTGLLVNLSRSLLENGA